MKTSEKNTYIAMAISTAIAVGVWSQVGFFIEVWGEVILWLITTGALTNGLNKQSAIKNMADR